MKYRNRKTREIVEVINFSSNSERRDEDYVSYIDSKGVEHHREKGLNINWDFEMVGCNDEFSYIQWEYMIKNVSSLNPMDTLNLVELGNVRVRNYAQLFIMIEYIKSSLYLRDL